MTDESFSERLAEIKERQPLQVVAMVPGGIEIKDSDFNEDVEWLISQLERHREKLHIAEKALERITCNNQSKNGQEDCCIASHALREIKTILSDKESSGGGRE